MRNFVIAVDGPAASGKGTVAQGLAVHFGLPLLDTGLLYRAVGVLAQRRTGAVDEASATAAARALDPRVLDDPELRARAAGELASQSAVFPGVRAALLDFQRAFAAQAGGAVLDGRDI
ncbi:MAG: (d)CMP kinase, partial [Caulobacteraceae bacterium]|nr:(d)CMP kinase [Caulobacteraceae bacterium]